ncbi:MAG: HAMP domain-containing histidine kinase [Thermodesulfovibrionales bacterium]|nr:HAMP domain-containing histidine kinase [Thermodesulfovibrionales bacterium]
MFKGLWFRFFLIFALLSSVSLLSAFILRVLMIGDFREYLEGELEDRVYWVMADIEGSYERHSGWDEGEVAQNVIRALLLGLDIRILDRDSKLIMDSEKAMNRLTPLMKRRVAALARIEDRGGEYLSYPLFLAGQEIGILELRFMKPLREEIFIKRTDSFLIISLIFFGGLSIFLSIVFSKRLTAPIKRLSSATQEIKRGNFDITVPVSGNDEIASLAEAFNSMVRSLRLQEDLRKKLISNAAHELRTPISAMRAELEGMIDGLIPVNQNELRSVYEEVRRLSGLVEAIEEFTRAQAGALNLKKEIIHLKPFLENIIDIHRRKIMERDISIELSCSEQLDLYADPEKLSQIVINLLSNAIKAVVEKGSIWIKAERSDGEVVIEFKDNGRGIREEDMPFIFERFYRRFEEGTGLGLSIVRELLEAHGGRIEVKSEIGKGAVFRIYLPQGIQR